MFLSQFDLRAFDIYRDPLDLDIVQALLKEKLSETVYSQIQEGEIAECRPY
ncbi:hypothetical protein [Risungbinella massiliensis]|uniref:hypothetical protein n=1 Tax=Risungbinella massiliensis TaxID=1329796 RepID=UPI0012B5DAB8|nr:hypothetical protein [Risungbinella massiliensis]